MKDTDTDFILDASIALSWCFPDETTPRTQALLKRLASHKAFAPSLWALETSNILIQSKQSGRITNATRMVFSMFLHGLPIVVDESSLVRTISFITPIADAYGLTTYDAAYLELAMRLKLPLATDDKKMRAAAKKCNVALL